VEALFTNDAVVLGVLMCVLGIIFYTSHQERFQRFYRFVPALFLCYFVPALLNWPLGLISPEGSQLYFVASRYLLPASLILLCISIDFKALLNLGSKAIIMFLAATLGIVLGGPVAVLFVSWFMPDVVSVPPDELWRGLSTIAGSWIGGGANQAAMKEIFEVSDNLFGSMLVVDIVVANIWMAFLFYGADNTKKIDKWLQSDVTAIEQLKTKVADYKAKVSKIPTTTDLFVMMAVAFGGVALSHWFSDLIVPLLSQHSETLESMRLNSLMSGFFWLIMKMDLKEVFNNLDLFAIGIIWILIHVIILFIVAKLIKAPFFYVAVGSQANIGGAASAPVVASAFSPTLAPVGALMAVLGYAVGTYGAIICAYLMQGVVS